MHEDVRVVLNAFMMRRLDEGDRALRYLVIIGSRVTSQKPSVMCEL